jgi:hypothetical protein
LKFKREEGKKGLGSIDEKSDNLEKGNGKKRNEKLSK